MSNSLDNSVLLDEGMGWVVRLTSGHATDVDAEALVRWRNQSSDHARAFHRAVAISDALVKAGQEGLVARSPVVVHRIQFNRRLAMGTGLTAAAAAAVVGIVKPPLDLWPSFGDLTADYRTVKGEQRHIAWARGVSVEMNTHTSISRHSQSDGDGLKLVSGEVSVKAELAEQQQLIVTAGSGSVTAQKAQFNVQDMGSTGICVTCVSGSVRVLARGTNATIAANQQLIYDGEVPHRVVTVNPAQFTAWRVGQIVLRDATLDVAVTEINRYRPGLVVIGNSALRRQRISTVLYLSELDQVIPLISRVTGAHASTVGDYTLLT